MNRLNHIKRTFLRNIQDNLQYENLEHIILNYNSQDELEEWAQENLGNYIRTGRVKHYKTFEPTVFNMAHSKNMVAKLASGAIVCLIDGDNYTGKGFAEFVNKCFNNEKDIFLTTIAARKVTNPPDVLGRVCFYRNAFYKVRGFDESMNSYGFDDYDFANRLALSGLKRKIITNKQYLSAISHSVEERMVNMPLYSNLKHIFIRYISPFQTNILFLLKDNSLSTGTIVNNNIKTFMRLDSLITKRRIKYADDLESSEWAKGKWKEINRRVIIQINGCRSQNILTFSEDKKELFPENDRNPYFLVESQQLISDLMRFHSVISNRKKMELNYRQKNIAPNIYSFGQGMVYSNFDRSNQIHL